MKLHVPNNPHWNAPRILQCTPEEYHKDPCAVPSLSHSIAHVLVAESPAHAWLRHPRLGGKTLEPTEPQSEGQILHGLLFGSGPELHVVEANDYRTKAAQRERDEALGARKVPVLSRRLVELARCADKVRESLGELGYKLDGMSETSIEWYEESTLCRCRIDHINQWGDGFVILDFKRLRSANPKHVAKAIYDYGYDIQAAAYCSALKHLMRDGEREPECEFVLLVSEPQEPYCVTPIKLDSSYQRLGRYRWAQAVDVWQQCLETDEWPAYEEAVVSPPGYVGYAHIEFGKEDEV